MQRSSLSCDRELEPLQAERPDRRGDLAGDGFGRAEIERAARNLALEFLARHRPPATLGADAVAHRLVGREEFLGRLGVAGGDIAG
jgi:hypothetical protein